MLHGLPLLALIGWRPATVEISAPIPVQLVIEQPPPIPEPAKPELPQARRASADMAELTTPQPEQGIAAAKTAAAAPEPAAEPQQSAAEPSTAPEPEKTAAEPEKAAVDPSAAPEPQSSAESQVTPAPSPEPAPVPPAEAETVTAMLLPRPAKPIPRRREPAPPAAMPTISAWPLPLHETRQREPRLPQVSPEPQAVPRFASLTGPAAIRDEYCVRALALTLRHLDLVPLSFLAGRRGKTVLTLRILGDGTVNSVTLAQSSGYPDIDQRIEKMVFAVGQYPPLPPRLPGRWTDFTFSMVFPDPAQR